MYKSTNPTECVAPISFSDI